jgi:NAD(P)-dependent dehydrogenase (short-subunit alcohol dehydrogenase family)
MNSQRRTAVVSGGASGLGAHIARGLAMRGWRVVIGCRDEVKGYDVAAAICSEAGSTLAATAMALDTSQPASIHAFAASYLRDEGSLDLLVNNAGAIFADRRTGLADGELTFITNVLGYHVLARELAPALLRADRARIVNVASTYAFGLELDDLHFTRRPYDAMTAYAQSKACDRMLTYALARRLHDSGITCNAVAPGLMLDTQLYRRLPPTTRQGLEQYPHHSVENGVDTPLWLATSPEVEGVTGRFFEARKELPCEFRNAAAEERLWAECERLAAAAPLPATRR